MTGWLMGHKSTSLEEHDALFAEAASGVAVLAIKTATTQYAHAEAPLLCFILTIVQLDPRVGLNTPYVFRSIMPRLALKIESLNTQRVGRLLPVRGSKGVITSARAGDATQVES